jgi:hypothetical protein
MTRQQNISAFIRRLAISLLLPLLALGASAQEKIFVPQKDSIPFFRGFAVSFDLVGPIMMQLSDYGEYEGALRLNLHDEWFPIVEVGYGKADHDYDEVTKLSYKTSAPYFRVGIDRNLLKYKHGVNRLYGGFRYAFTSYKVDVAHKGLVDPVWLWNSSFGVVGDQCSQHWIEVVMGIDAQIFGPLHLGWSVRYKRRISHDDGMIGKTWYIPGFGIWEDTRLGGTFNVIIDI